ncbi:MAG TPA: AMP-binding protein, partial [Kribbellaceae bacterium]
GVVGHGMPNFHCGGTISLGLRAMLFGQTLLTLTTAGFRSREVVASFWDIARYYRMTSLLATPTTAAAILAAGGDSTGHDVADFHVGGSAVPMDLVRAFHERFGIWLRENWGMTELHGTVTGHYNDGSRPLVGSAGRALPHFRVRAVELDEAGRYVRDCAPGERGALLIGGPSVTDGYLAAEHDAEFFPADLDGDLRWGNTGDLGTVDADGYVWVFGRAKDLIIRGGHNIDPREIEEALARHPAVHLAAAVGRPDAGKGELPMAYVQLKDGATAEPAELLEFCRGHVQEKAAIPAELVVLDELPLTPVGKVSKPALRADALEREVRTLVADPSYGCEVRVDSSGPRQRVVVVLDGADEDTVSSLARRLAAYDFASSVHTLERS